MEEIPHDTGAAVVRPAKDADVQAVCAIYADAVLTGTASYELDPPDLSEMAARMQAVRDSGLPWFVADASGTVVGYAYVSPFRPRPAYRFTLENSIYVAPQAKGRGIGRALLQALVDAAAARGYRQIVAVIGDGHEASPSVRLHAALGFTHAGRVIGSGYKFGRWLDTTYMQRALNGGNATPPDPDSAPEQRFRRR